MTLVVQIDLNRDSLLSEFGKKTLFDRYLLPEETSPQHGFARAAKAFASNDAHAQRIYDYASNLWLSFATPILSNGGTKLGMPISCFSGMANDTRTGILEHVAEISWLSSYGGGSAGYWGKLRSNGVSTSHGTKSTGIIPFIKMVESATLAFQQGNNRRGAYAAYLDISHPEILEFINFRKPTGGDQNRKCLELHNAVVITDAFMEAIEKDSMWNLIDPHTKKIVDTVNARELFISILELRLKTGEPYIWFVDTVRKYQHPSHIAQGLFNTHSNLCCVTEDQLVNTEFGLMSVKDLHILNKPFKVFNNNKLVNASKMFKIAENIDILNIQTKQGYTHKVTPNHKVMVKDVGWVEAQNLCVGDKLLIQSNFGVFGKIHQPDLALLNGLYHSDGTSCDKRIYLDLYSNKTTDFVEEFQNAVNNVYEEFNLNYSVISDRGTYNTPTFNSAYVIGDYKKLRLGSVPLKNLLKNKGEIPDFVLKGDLETISYYLRGLYLGDGTFQSSNGISSLSYTSTNKQFLQNLQILLTTIGIRSTLTTNHKKGFKLLPDGLGGSKEYLCNETFRLLITNYPDIKTFEDLTGFIKSRGIELQEREVYKKKDYTIVTSIKPADKEDVYCIEVDTDDHAWVCNGFITHNSEISLPTNHERTFVCCLSSLNLEKWDEWKDNEIFISDVTEYLDNVMQYFIDNAPDHLSKARFSAMMERSIGIGTLGWHSLLQSKLLPFEGPLAIGLNKKIFSHIKEKAFDATKKLAEERGATPDYLNHPIGVPVRNMHLMAVAPNASSSIICGETSPSIEPWKANLFVHKTKSGSFLVKNKHLEKLLDEKQQNTDEVWQSIIDNEGSVQHLEILNDWEKSVFKTALELDQMWLIQHASDRQPYICQSQSLNLFFPANVDTTTLLNVHYKAWKQGIKSLYYLRSTTLKQVDNMTQKIKRVEKDEHVEDNDSNEECFSCSA